VITANRAHYVKLIVALDGGGSDTAAGYRPDSSGTTRGAGTSEAGHDELSESVGEAEGALERFYADLWWELGEFIHGRRATAAGAAVIVKRVARAQGVRVAEDLPLPRLTRAERKLAEDGP